MARVLDEDELIEHWTLVGDELDLLTGRTGPSRLGLALWLKFFIMKGCFPAGRSELPDEAVGWVASQVKVSASDLGLFDWEGRTAERARKTVRTFLGFRECSVADAEKLIRWLAGEVCSRERHVQRVREALLARLREEQIEQPSRIRLGRMIGSALRQSEETLTAKVSSRLHDEVTARMWSMIAAAGDDPGVPPGEGPDGWLGAADGSDPGEVPGPEVWAALRSDPGNVSLYTCKSERRKLDWIRAVRLPSGVLADIAPKIVAGWRARVAVESPSHLRNDHPGEGRWTRMAAYLHCREREITDGLVELLIATVHPINARAETRTREQFVSDIAKKVTGKENILFSIAAAAAGKPHGIVEEVVYPAAGGLEVLLDLVRECESKGPTYRQARQRSFKASYTNHYRAGLIQILEALEFRSNNMVHRPVLEALELIKRYKAEHSSATLYYARGEHVPVDGVIPRDLADLLYKTDKRGRRRVQRTVYECGVFQTLRDKLRCKEIWVVGADKWRNPGRGPPGRPQRPPAGAGLGGHQGTAEGRADHPHRPGRRARAAQPAAAQGGDPGPVGHRAAARHADRDRAAHRLPGRLHPGRHPRRHRRRHPVPAAAADRLRLRDQHRNPGGGRRRARPRRGRAALCPAPLHHRGVVPAGRPGNRERDKSGEALRRFVPLSEPRRSSRPDRGDVQGPMLRCRGGVALLPAPGPALSSGHRRYGRTLMRPRRILCRAVAATFAG